MVRIVEMVSRGHIYRGRNRVSKKSQHPNQRLRLGVRGVDSQKRVDPTLAG